MNVTPIHSRMNLATTPVTDALPPPPPGDSIFADLEKAGSEFCGGVETVTQMIAQALAGKNITDDEAEPDELMHQKDLDDLIQMGHFWDPTTMFILRMAVIEDRFGTIDMLSMWASLAATLFSGYLKEFGYQDAAARYDLACQTVTTRSRDVPPEDLGRMAMCILRTGSLLH